MTKKELKKKQKKHILRYTHVHLPSHKKNEAIIYKKIM